MEILPFATAVVGRGKEVDAMGLEDRVMEMIATFSGADEEAITPEDLLRQEDGGWFDEEELLALIDELEGEFGITINERDLGGVQSVEELIDMVQNLVVEKLAADEDLV